MRPTSFKSSGAASTRGQVERSISFSTGGAAGYFVRPFRPFLWLLVIALLASLVRLRRERRRSAAQRRGRRITPQFTWRLIEETAATVQDALPSRFGGGGGKRTRRLELWTYRLLLACIVVGLLSNPSFREAIELLT